MWDGRYAVGDWIELNVKGSSPSDAEIGQRNSTEVGAHECSIECERQAWSGANGNVLPANAAEIVPTSGATVGNPTFIEAFVIRADLDRFTVHVEAAFAKNDQNAIKGLVLEFLQISENFQTRLRTKHGAAIDPAPLGRRLQLQRPCWRQRLRELRSRAQITLPAACIFWRMARSRREGKRHTRPKSCRGCPPANKWSIGALVEAGRSRRDAFLSPIFRPGTVASSLSQVGGRVDRWMLKTPRGLSVSESALHDEDYAELDDACRKAYNGWDTGPTDYRKSHRSSSVQAGGGWRSWGKVRSQ